MLGQTLLLDASGRPLRQKHRTHSRDWDEIRSFCDSVYMPYQVRPLKKDRHPNATMYSTKVGSIVVTKFGYGVPIRLSDFSPEAGNILVLTTLQGTLRHGVERKKHAVTVSGESFVADCSRTEYWLEGDAQHLQYNLTIPHAKMEATALDWLGFIPDDTLWKRKVKFGGVHSSWWAFLAYLMQVISENPPPKKQPHLIAHVEQSLCLQLLVSWTEQAGLDLSPEHWSVAPKYILRAEEYMRAHAQQAPTLSEVARVSGVSIRALSGAFRRYRGMTPYTFLREQRLQGIRKALRRSSENDTISTIVSDWGYCNFGVFAKAYKNRFGELPSETVKRSHYR
ncbi:AraC family transcriptional regulator [Desulfovibrio inopinatus]|uniref:AraC family transcriptional regulator n=1 Tax=Desulfovibrio inopinatus TaxID=102109 RepID=UPI000408164A|nr:helix-turn-helix domain-containing protein [Desulfovibrio inopinatus]